MIADEPNMTALSENLVYEANDAGGRDNVTVICIKKESKGAQ